MAALVALVILATLSKPLIDTVERSLGTLPGMQTKDSMEFASPEMAMYDRAMAPPGMGAAMPAEIGIPPMPPPDGAVDEDAEDYEITEYNVNIETRTLEEDCKTITNLKPLNYVIFESTTETDKSCYYTIKVDVSHVEEVLSVLEDLDPKDLNKTTYTIQRTIEYLLDEREVLEKKREAIEETLEDALNAYDEISRFATETRDADALARIIDSKIQTVERLTMESININERLNRLAQQEVRQMDRLKYTYFYINVTESKFFDGKEIKESWKESAKKLVKDFNKTIQGLSLGLITLALFIVQFGIYLLILIVVARFLWKFTKRIWKK